MSDNLKEKNKKAVMERKNERENVNMVMEFDKKILKNEEKIKRLRQENKLLLQKQKEQEEKNFKEYQKKIFDILVENFKEFEDDKKKIDLKLLGKYFEETKEFAQEIFQKEERLVDLDFSQKEMEEEIIEEENKWKK